MATQGVTVKFTSEELKRIDCLVKNNQATSRSDVIRYALRKYLDDTVCLGAASA